MNYEELIASRREKQPQKTHLPIGEYFRQQTDGKYHSYLEIRPELNSNIKFSEALKTECQQNSSLTNSHLLHFRPVGESSDIEKIELEQGHYQPLSQLLNDTPAVVAEKGFFDNLTNGLLDAASYLHSKGIYHVCFSPQTVFIRKGDNGVLLLSHGSYYLGMSEPGQLYDGFEDFVAPEVLNRGTVDERCDIYSIGKLLTCVFDSSDMPLEYRRVLKKAVSQSPEDRYSTPEEMLNAINNKRNTYRSAVSFAVAVVIALLCVGLYFELFPETETVEFVKPAPRQATDDLLDDGFRPEELGIVDSDSLTEEERISQQEYQAKAEEIFRKRYEQEADRILSKIYNKNSMNVSEKNFLARNQETVEDLMKAQMQIADEAAISQEKSQLIATEIIERLTEQKKQALGGSNGRGIQK